MSETEILLPLGGALTGAGTYATIGGMGLVGGFGGIGLGLGAMTGIGAVTGTALYGGIQAWQTGDRTAYVATGLGSLAGVGLYNTIGGVGLGVGGTAFGLGMGAMAFSGGILGLGIYGLAKMFDIKASPESFGETYTRIEEKISYQEAYNQAMMEIDPTLAELSWQQKWAEIEIEDELKELKENLAGNIDYTRLNKTRLLKAKREELMTQLKQTYSSSQKYKLLKEIDEVERQIKEISLFNSTSVDVEIEDELNELKENLAGNIDYKRLNENRRLKAKREELMTQLKQTYSSSQKYKLLKEIDEVERQIKEISLFK